MSHGIQQRKSLYVYDFTIPAKDISVETVTTGFTKMAKKWVFQKESGQTTGYEHYQCRISLHQRGYWPHVARMLAESGMPRAHISITTNLGVKRFDFYCMKTQTRIEGPWTDKDAKTEPEFVPVQYAGLEKRLNPFQQRVWDSSDKQEWRRINLIIDPVGGIGKTTVASLMELHGRGIDMPPINDSQVLTQSLCNILSTTENRDPKCILFDIPRACSKSALHGLFSAIEQIKKGKIYDTRYKYMAWWFNSPQIWVFTNCTIDSNLLSADRWQIWRVDAFKELYMAFE